MDDSAWIVQSAAVVSTVSGSRKSKACSAWKKKRTSQRAGTAHLRLPARATSASVVSPGAVVVEKRALTSHLLAATALLGLLDSVARTTRGAIMPKNCNIAGREAMSYQMSYHLSRIFDMNFERKVKEGIRRLASRAPHIFATISDLHKPSSTINNGYKKLGTSGFGLSTIGHKFGAFDFQRQQHMGTDCASLLTCTDVLSISAMWASMTFHRRSLHGLPYILGVGIYDRHERMRKGMEGHE